MMYVKAACFMLAVSLCLYACNHDDDITKGPGRTIFPNYMPLKTGNYWIYRNYNIDVNGIETATSNYDSCFMEKDTLINGKTFFKFISPNIVFNTFQVPPVFLRDSLHYIVDEHGTRLFSSQDFTSVMQHWYHFNFPDTVAEITVKMEDKDLMIAVPAGNFRTSNYKATYKMYPGYDDAGVIRQMNTRYSEAIGIVTETTPMYVANPGYVEKRLIRFKLN